MAWKQGVIIRGGDLQGSFIPIQSNLVYPASGVYGTNFVGGDSESVYDVTQSYYNNNIGEMIDVSSYFTTGSALFADTPIAEMAVVDEDRQVTGYFCLYLSKIQDTPYMRFIIKGKVKNASGVVIGDLNPSGGKEIDFSLSSTDRDEPIVYLCFAETTYNNHKIFGLYFNGMQLYHGGRNIVTRAYAGLYQDNDAIYTQWGIGGDIDTERKTKSPEFGPASEPSGGYNDIPNNPHGTFDDSSDEIALDAKPTYGVTSVGFINVYKIEQDELINLGEKLFPHFLPAEILADPSQLSVQEVLVWFIKMAYGTLIAPTGTTVELNDNLGIFDILMNGKLIDYVLDCHVIPTSISGATISPLKIGYRTFNDFQLAKATEDYVDVDCGELYIKEFYGNFLDYSGNLKVELYLPMVGFVPIDNEFWNNATIKVIYRFNIIDGSFQAKIFTTREDDKSKIHNSLVAQYGGVCCVHFPITGMQYSNVISGLVNGGTSAVLQGSSGHVAGAVSSAFNMAMLKPDNPSSNGYNASSSFLSHRTPYLVIKMPVAQFSENYPKEIGLPLNVTYPLSQIHGFTVIENPVLNIRCSDEEYNELVSLLRSGVIF